MATGYAGVQARALQNPRLRMAEGAPRGLTQGALAKALASRLSQDLPPVGAAATTPQLHAQAPVGPRAPTGSTAPAGPAGPTGQTAAASGNPIYDALVAAARAMHADETWTDTYRQALLSEIIPNAQKLWGDQRILAALGGDWPLYALQIAMSTLGLGPDVYDRTGDGSTANKVFVPWSGYKSRGPATISGTRTEEPWGAYGRYDDAGRYLGHRSGLIDGRYVY